MTSETRDKGSARNDVPVSYHRAASPGLRGPCQGHLPRETMNTPLSSARLILMLGTISALVPLSIDMYLPVFPVIARELAAPVASVQLTLSAFFVGIAAGQVFYGPLSDHYGRRRPLLLGIALYTCASAGCALAPDLPTLIALRTLQALGACSGMVIALAIVRDLYDAHDGARVMSRLWLVFGAAPIIAPSLGAWVVKLAGWRLIFWILAAVGLLCLLAVLLLLPESRRQPAGPRPMALRPVLRDYATLLTQRQFLGLAAAVAMAHAAILAYVTAGPFVLIEVYGVTPAQFALLFALNASALVISAQWNAQLLRRHGPSALLARANLLPPLLGIALIALTASRAGGVATIMVVLFLYLSATAIIRPNATACALAAHGERAGTAISIIGCGQFLFGTLAGAFMSLIHDGSARPLAITMTLLALSGLLLQRWLARNPSAS